MEMIGTAEVAAILGVSQRLVSKWLDDGRIPGWRVPNSRHRRFRRSAIVEYARQHGIRTVAMDSESDDSESLAPHAVAKAVDMPLETVRRWIDEGRLPSRQVGATRRVEVDDLLEFCNANEIRMRLD